MTISARIPNDIAAGAQGGPTVDVEVNDGDGIESRNIVVDDDGEEWNIGYGIKTIADLQTIKTMFRAHRGPAYPFRFRVPDDYTLTSELIGTGDAADTTFQAIKTYATADRTIVRTIKALVTGTLTVVVNGVTKTETTHYTVNYDTGVITFLVGSIPGTGHEIRITAEFDIFARFVDRQLRATVDYIVNGGLGAVPTIMIKEDKTV